MAAGRPIRFKSAAELASAVDEYFVYIKGEYHYVYKEDLDVEVKECVRDPEPPTITGLALHLGFESRQSVYDYEKSGKYSYVIKNARLRVEHGYEKRLFTDKPVGAIFALKNMGWKDRTELEHSGPEGGAIQITGMEVK